MNTENTRTETTAATPADSKGDQKTFSQDDVNRIVQERLAKDRAKASEEMSAKEQELAQREFRLNNRQKLINRGYPESFLDVLNCSNEEAFDKALDALDKLMEERGVSDRQTAAAQKVPKFTSPMSREGLSEKLDPFRKAMGL